MEQPLAKRMAERAAALQKPPAKRLPEVIAALKTAAAIKKMDKLLDTSDAALPPASVDPDLRSNLKKLDIVNKVRARAKTRRRKKKVKEVSDE